MRKTVLFLAFVFLFTGACSNKSAENAQGAKDGAASSSAVTASSLAGTYTSTTDETPLLVTETLTLQADGTATYTFNLRGDEQQVKSYNKNIMEKTGTFEVAGQKVGTNMVIEVGKEISELNFDGVEGADPIIMAGLVAKAANDHFPGNAPITLEFQVKGNQLEYGSRIFSKQ